MSNLEIKTKVLRAEYTATCYCGKEFKKTDRMALEAALTKHWCVERLIEDERINAALAVLCTVMLQQSLPQETMRELLEKAMASSDPRVATRTGRWAPWSGVVEPDEDYDDYDDDWENYDDD